jgi:GDP-L-fucose synthase
MPTNLYGPNDNFDLESSHVLPALMRKFHDAKLMGLDSVEIWGSGTARREFLHVDDLADACLFLLRNYNSSGQINIGTGKEVSIQELAETLRDVIYPDAELHWDTTKPDGAPRKLLDVSKIEAAGWSHSIALSDGINSTYEWFTDQYENVRGR